MFFLFILKIYVGSSLTYIIVLRVIHFDWRAQVEFILRIKGGIGLVP